jgi:hypothetical protein
MMCCSSRWQAIPKSHIQDSYFHITAHLLEPFAARRTASYDPESLIGGVCVCGCRQCALAGAAAVLADRERLAFHNLWTIRRTGVELRRLIRGQDRGVDECLQDAPGIHSTWFPTSQLRHSWDMVSP